MLWINLNRKYPLQYNKVSISNLYYYCTQINFIDASDSPSADNLYNKSLKTRDKGIFE